MELVGSCQCGRVRFRATAEKPDAYFCHCRMCQRAFGNVFATYVNVAKADITWETEPDWYVSSKIARRPFCSTCGTPLGFEYNDSKRIDLAVGALEHPEMLKPMAHVGIESRIAPFHEPGKLEEKRIADFDHILKKWKTAYGDDVVPGADATRKK